MHGPVGGWHGGIFEHERVMNKVSEMEGAHTAPGTVPQAVHVRSPLVPAAEAEISITHDSQLRKLRHCAANRGPGSVRILRPGQPGSSTPHCSMGGHILFIPVITFMSFCLYQLEIF